MRMTERKAFGKKLITQLFFFLVTNNCFVKCQVGQFCTGLSVLRSYLNTKAIQYVSSRHNILSSIAYFSAASKGLLDAAHFCYLMAQVGFGVYTRKTTKLVLIGSNHRFGFPFLKQTSLMPSRKIHA